MTTPDRERSLEQWLRHTPIPGAAPDRCLDAETLAAWAEGVLDGPARTSAEAHAASCGRCQAMLAVMARTAPASAPAAGSSLRKWMMMLGPAAAAVAAVALWFAVDRRPEPSVAVQTADRVANAAPSAAVPAPPLPTEKDSGALRDSRTALDSDASKDLAAARQDRRERASADKNAVDSLAKRKADDRENEKVAASPSSPVAGASKSTPPGAVAESVPVTAGSRTAAAPASSPVNAPYPGPPPLQQMNQANQVAVTQGQMNQRQASQAQPVESKTEQAKQAEAQAAGRPQPVAEPVSVARERAAATPAVPPAPAAADEFRRSARFAAAIIQAVAPDNSVRWRVVDGRLIQRSTDAGATWANQFTAADTVALNVGVAPSSTVCWFVGRSGAVLRTTDGRTWQLVTFPEPVDLVAVTSADARSATVTAVDGRVFLTADGGVTWNRR